MNRLRYLHPRFAAALWRNICIKLRYGSAIDFDIFRTFFGSRTIVAITGGGSIRLHRGGKRILFSEGCEIRASGGRLEVLPGAFFNRNCSLVAHQSISVGADCMFGPGVCVYDSDHAFDRTDVPFSAQGYRKAGVSFGTSVWVGANTVVTRGTTVEDYVVIGANSVVKGTLARAAVYAGNPLRRVRAVGPKEAQFVHGA